MGIRESSPLATQLQGGGGQVLVGRSVDDLAHACGARVENVVEALVEQLCGFAGATADNWITILERKKSFSISKL